MAEPALLARNGFLMGGANALAFSRRQLPARKTRFAAVKVSAVIFRESAADVTLHGAKVVPWIGGTGSETMLVAARDFAPGEVIGTATGCPVVDAPSIFTVQVSATKHVDPEFTTLEKANHSCEPNCDAMVDVDSALFGLRAITAIPAGTPLSFDYCTTEWSMDAPFRCECGSATCRGEIRGFNHMNAATKATLLPRASAHIKLLHNDAASISPPPRQ